LTAALLTERTASGRLRGGLFLVGMLLSAALLLFCRLDDAYLWQDEAETAIVSRNLLNYGLPLSTNGTNWVQQAPQMFIEFTDDYVWIYHSWLQYAVTAASFALFGVTTFAARLPFVLVGLLTIYYFYGFVSRWLADTRIARVATLLLVFCIPFVLLLRQSRYYALAAFFTLLTVDAYLRLTNEGTRPDLQSGQTWAVPYFVLSAVLLYHSHYGAFFPTMVAVALDFVLSRPARRALRRLLMAFLLLAVLALPWARLMRVQNRGGPFQIDRFLSHIGQYSLYITAWLFPLVLVPFLLIAFIRPSLGRDTVHHSQGHRLELSPGQTTFCRLVGLEILLTILPLSASAAFDWAFFRYLAHLIPLLSILLAVVVVWFMERSTLIGYTLLTVLVVSNALHVLPYGLPGVKGIDWKELQPASPPFQALDDVWAKAGRFRSDVWMYAQELSHSYEGPNEGLVKYLSVHAQPGQTVVVNYEDLPLMFYTELRVLGGLSGRGLADNAQPDWVIDRQHGPYRDRLATIVASGSYERVEIHYPDIRWENRPQPGQHHYLTVRGENRVALYRKQGG
jgi:4-amino-4-deoxy-L-arabinose transferase-like glycosyltransferase